LNDREKLKSLLHHWREHNQEHSGVYSEWARKASALGNEDLSLILTTISRETQKLDELFKRAIAAV
jgi:hypothetical protein